MVYVAVRGRQTSVPAQASGLGTTAVPGSALLISSALSGLDEAHPHWGRKNALLSPLALLETPRHTQKGLARYLGSLWPSQFVMKITQHTHPVSCPAPSGTAAFSWSPPYFHIELG